MEKDFPGVMEMFYNLFQVVVTQVSTTVNMDISGHLRIIWYKFLKSFYFIYLFTYFFIEG